MAIVDLFAVETDHELQVNVPQGYTLLPVDLNTGAGGRYIYLLYKSEPNPLQYITEINFVYGDRPGMPAPEGYLLDKVDLNAGAGGQYIYLCTRMGTGEETPVTDLQIIEGDHAVYPLYMNTQLSPDGPDDRDFWKIIPLDLNLGAGGKYIYLCYKKMYTAFISDVSFITGDNSEIQPPSPWYRMPLDLNKGVGGKYIYLCYRRDGIPVSNLVVISATDPDIGPPPGYQKAVNLESNLPQDLDEGAGGCYIYVCLEKDITSKQFMYGVNLVCDAADSRIKSSQYISYPKLGMYCNGGDTEFNGTCSGVRHTYEPIPIAAPPGFIGLREYLNTDRSHRISLLFQLMDATKIDLSDLFQMEAKRWEPAMRRYRSIQDISLLQFIETGVKEGSKVLKPVRNIPELVRQYYLNGKERLCDDSLTLVRDLIFRQRAHELIKREKIKKEKTK